MPETVQKNFRMSLASVRLLDQIAAQLGITATDVMELCVARHAAAVEQDIETAREVFVERIAGAIAQKPNELAGIFVARNFLPPLDKLAARLNTTRGKLVEALLSETQSRHWMETSAVARRFTDGAGDGAGAVNLTLPSERKASAVASDLLAAQVSASSLKREAGAPSVRTSAPGAAGRANPGRKPSTPKPALR